MDEGPRSGVECSAGKWALQKSKSWGFGTRVQGSAEESGAQEKSGALGRRLRGSAEECDARRKSEGSAAEKQDAKDKCFNQEQF